MGKCGIFVLQLDQGRRMMSHFWLAAETVSFEEEFLQI